MKKPNYRQRKAKNKMKKWKIDDNNALPLAVIEDDEHGNAVCEIGERTPENLANARLIAIAPILERFFKNNQDVKGVWESACIAFEEELKDVETAMTQIRQWEEVQLGLHYGTINEDWLSALRTHLEEKK